MDFREFFVETLWMDAEMHSLVGDRIFPLVLPDEFDERVKENVPFILYQLVSQPTNAMRFPIIQVKVCGLVYQELVQIGERIQQLFAPPFKYHGDGLDIEAVTVQSDFDTTDDSTGITLMVKMLEIKFALRSY